MLRLRRVVAASLLSTVSTIGCVSSDPTATTPASDATNSTDDEMLRGTCTSPRRYIAVLEQAECAEVQGLGGRWLPSPLFDDAPAGSGACFYTWSGLGRVDRGALQQHVGERGALTPSACGSEELEIDVPLVEVDGPAPGAQVGAVGCDVCGIQKNGRVWVVVPPEKVLDRMIFVKLSNGGEKFFRLDARPDARRIAVDLPPPPAGTRYLNGRIFVQ